MIVYGSITLSLETNTKVNLNDFNYFFMKICEIQTTCHRCYDECSETMVICSNSGGNDKPYAASLFQLCVYPGAELESYSSSGLEICA